MQVTRKSFLQAAVSIVGASTLGVAACGDDSGSGGGGTSSSTGSGSGNSSSTSGSSSSSSGSGSGSSSSTSGSTSGSGSSSSSGGMLTCTPQIGANHGHAIEVTAADVMAGADKTYDIQGSSPHVHSVTITAADFTTLSQGGTVMKMSTSSGDHAHMVTVTCA